MVSPGRGARDAGAGDRLLALTEEIERLGVNLARAGTDAYAFGLRHALRVIDTAPTLAAARGAIAELVAIAERPPGP